ncbi:MAG: nucleotide exchange factor GrpE [Chloroflexi bacterium]|nr:nucleotide exchange factor GrpE [Chloroflexota bacterium]
MKKKNEGIKEQDPENDVPESSDEQDGSQPESLDDEAQPATEIEDTSPEFLADKLNALETELEEQRLKTEEYLDGWQRAIAEFSNYKKRVQREREEDHARLSGQILSRYLDVVDDFERALKDSPSGEDIRAWTEGIDLIYRKLNTILETEGVEEIEAEGVFDPIYHEAIFQEEVKGYKEGEIVEVIQRGYKIGDRVLRPAQVRIAK